MGPSLSGRRMAVPSAKNLKGDIDLGVTVKCTGGLCWRLGDVLNSVLHSTPTYGTVDGARHRAGHWTPRELLSGS